MIYSLFADAILIVHLFFIVFAVAGGLLVLKWSRLVWLHMAAVGWAVWIALSGSICPLTPLEQLLRQKSGEASYSGGFIEHYLEPIIYPESLTREAQWWIAVFLLVVNILAYLLVFRARRKRRAQQHV